MGDMAVLCTAAEAQITEHTGGGVIGIDGLMYPCACSRVAFVPCIPVCVCGVCIIARACVNTCMCMCSLWGVCSA